MIAATAGLPMRTRVRVAARWLWRALTAPRYPLLVVLLLFAGSLAAIAGLVLGIERVLDRLEHRSEYSECVDDREVAFETAVGDILDLLLDPAEANPVRVAVLRDNLAEATARLRSIDHPAGSGGCPGQADTLP